MSLPLLQLGGGSGGGSGTVTSFSSGNFGTIATTSVATATTTPALSFSLATQSANTVWAGPTTGAAGAPTFRALVAADLPAGTGTVTSFSAGALSPLFTTSVATATTTPALSFSLSNAAGGTVLGNSTGSSGAPAYTATPVLGINTSVAGTLGLATSVASGATITLQNLGALTAYNFNLPITVGAAGSVLTSQAGGTTSMTWSTQASLGVAWSSLTAASGNLSLSNAANTTTFNQTSNVAWLWANTTTGTASTTNASPLLELAANYYTGSASAQDLWTMGFALGSGTNGDSAFTIKHTGSTTGGILFSLSGGTNHFLLNQVLLELTDSTACYLYVSRGYILGPASCVIGFTSSTNAAGSQDTSITRISANVLGIGNGSAGDFSGSAKYTGYVSPFSVALTGQAATIAATNLVATPVTTALYEVNYYLNDTTAGTSGTVSVTIAWNDGAAQSFTSANVTFGTLGAYVSGSIIVKATSGAITYATTVTSAVGSPAYSLDIRVVQLN